MRASVSGDNRQEWQSGAATLLLPDAAISAYQIIPRRTRSDCSDNIIAAKVSLAEGAELAMTSGQTTVTCCDLQHVCDSPRQAARPSGKLAASEEKKKSAMRADMCCCCFVVVFCFVFFHLNAV